VDRFGKEVEILDVDRLVEPKHVPGLFDLFLAGVLVHVQVRWVAREEKHGKG
jgi:hypothetical protein